MSIIIWIIQSFFWATWMVLTKKVVLNKKVWNNLQTFLNRSYHLIVILIVFNLWLLENDFIASDFKNYDYFLLILASLWLYITYWLRRIAYANEKVSVLQPFAMLFQVFPVILAFIFIWTERSNPITFLSALLASFIVIWTSIDFKKFKINKYSLMVLGSSTIKSFQLFVSLYFLSKVNPASFYFIETIVILIISIIILTYKKEFSELKLLSKKYIKLVIFTNTVVIISIFLVLTMYSSLWVVLTSLISLFYLGFVYLLSYLILNEKASKKDVVIAILVSICIIVWVVFKN